jgi:hypothetical protein
VVDVGSAIRKFISLKILLFIATLTSKVILIMVIMFPFMLRQCATNAIATEVR